VDNTLVLNPATKCSFPGSGKFVAEKGQAEWPQWSSIHKVASFHFHGRGRHSRQGENFDNISDA